MKLLVDERWRVRAEHAIDLPLPASAVWGQMRDLLRFITLDPLHVRVRLADHAETKPIPKQGDALIIEHRLLGVGPNRLSRVLRWREGSGYAVSDVSNRGVQKGFPHVCMYSVNPTGPRSSRLVLEARGRWTARFIPRWLVKVWLWWVLRDTGARIRAEMAAVSLLRLRQRAQNKIETRRATESHGGRA